MINIDVMNDVMLSAVNCYAYYCCAECRYAESCYAYYCCAECRYTERHLY